MEAFSVRVRPGRAAFLRNLIPFLADHFHLDEAANQRAKQIAAAVEELEEMVSGYFEKRTFEGDVGEAEEGREVVVNGLREVLDAIERPTVSKKSGQKG